MTEKCGKKAVIISNIKSNSIEQAIFILKESGAENTNAGSGIVAEAQEIINNYIKKVERAMPYRAKYKNRKRNTLLAIIAASVTIVGSVLFFGYIMS